MSTISMPICNRDFRLPADQKIHVVPLGEYPVQHQGKTVVQVVDERACSLMLNNFQREAQNPDFGGLCVDYEHFRHDPSKEGRAAAWIDMPHQAEVRPRGLFVTPRWTSGGTVAVQSGEYRFISPEFDPSTLEHVGGNRYRPTRLVGFGLTNNPNMRGMVPITNRFSEAAGSVDIDTQGTADAKVVSDLARTLRSSDKTLSISASYAHATRALNAEEHASSALVISNRARTLCAADRNLPLSAAYHRAQDAQTNDPHALLIATRARKLCAADKYLSLSAAYRRAQMN